MKPSAKGLRALLFATSLSCVGHSFAYVLLATPPGNRLTMNLDMLPTTPMNFIEGSATWNQAPETAMFYWNQAGIGPGLDHAFFTKASPAVTGNQCTRDGINEVRWTSDICGMAFGSAIAVTFTRSIDGKAVEKDMLFDIGRAWNAYSGPLRQASGGGTLFDVNRVALHEMGHAAGLNHPDEAGQSVVSIMNANISNLDSLQPDDIAGAHAIAWGTSQPAQGAVLEYIDTIDFPKDPGGHFFYTNDPIEIQNLDAGVAGHFQRTGLSFKSGGTKQLCRFYGSVTPGPNSHFFTLIDYECAGLINLQVTPIPQSVQQWNYEGLVFSEFPPLTDQAGKPTGCTSGTTPIYRYYNNAYAAHGKNPWDSNHRYGSDKTALDAFAATNGWIPEGVVFCTPL